MPSSGPNYPGTVAIADSGSAWSNTGNVSADDAAYASTSFAFSAQSLIVSNFGFSIPTDATIDGIVVEIERRASASFSATDTDDFDGFKLRKAGTAVGTAKNDNATYYPTGDTVATYGGASDLWGTTWTAADINNSGFGFKFRCGGTGKSSKVVYVDFIRITVHYTDSGGGGGNPQFVTRPAALQPILAR